MNRLSTMRRHSKKREAGFSLLETLFACVILMICASGILSLFAVALVKNANEGDDATRTTEYAQDKMEQLMTLQFRDTTSNTIDHYTGSAYTLPCLDLNQYSTVCSGGKGLLVGGSLTANTAGYVDYVSQVMNSNSFVSSDATANAQFVRRWLITNDSTGNIKTISVTVISIKPLAQGAGAAYDGIAPQTTLISQKSNVEDNY